MNTEINQIVFNPNDMSYKMHLFFLGSQHVVALTAVEAKGIIDAARDGGAEVNVELGTRQKPETYFIFYNKKQ